VLYADFGPVILSGTKTSGNEVFVKSKDLAAACVAQDNINCYGSFDYAGTAQRVVPAPLRMTV